MKKFFKIAAIAAAVLAIVGLIFIGVSFFTGEFDSVIEMIRFNFGRLLL
ncbi:hypothetical protein [Oceanirhabdus seepicola]|uniref:Uncharacterized protein n=1 Tax=Oceanirhabdus seepicola TaxID=2828781 RepID=A0A9J6P403_9CLOT|nr:hypothetical protein [Oceanirhabdus seepicola]MCM1991431.1 hypothetical protein [Oceanirhabdus seepicola]